MYLQNEAFSRINTMERSGVVTKFQLQTSNDLYFDGDVPDKRTATSPGR